MDPSTAKAQDLEPLVDAYERGAPRSYIALRCSGLIINLVEGSGPDSMGQENYDLMHARARNFYLAAISFYAEEAGIDEDTARDHVIEAMREVMDAYDQRMARNLEQLGYSFNSDPVIRSDMDFCAQIELIGPLDPEKSEQ